MVTYFQSLPGLFDGAMVVVCETTGESPRRAMEMPKGQAAQIHWQTLSLSGFT